MVSGETELDQTYEAADRELSTDVYDELVQRKISFENEGLSRHLPPFTTNSLNWIHGYSRPIRSRHR